MPLVVGFPVLSLTAKDIPRFLLRDPQLLPRTVEKRMNMLPELLLGATKLKFPLVPNYPMTLATPLDTAHHSQQPSAFPGDTVRPIDPEVPKERVS